MSKILLKFKNNIDKILMFVCLGILFFVCGVSNYVMYLSIKHQNEIVQTVNHKDWSAEQIQGLFNSKTNE